MLKAFAVAALLQLPDGNLEHKLGIFEAEGVDEAEAQMIARCVSGGRRLASLLSQTCDLDDVGARS